MTLRKYTPAEEQALLAAHQYEQELQQKIAATGQPPVLSFFDENRFLSNFHPVPGQIIVRGLEAETAEQIYQALKTKNPELQEAILAAATPGKAKRLGSALTTEQMRPGWDAIKLGIMAEIITAKFSQETLAEQLVSTGDAVLIEGNDWCDVYWGMCSCAVHNGAGLNLLGAALMIERSKIVAGWY